MFVLAHLSDLHLGPLPEPSLFQLVGKRLTGYLNWKLRRGPHHSRAVLDALTHDLLARNPDHIVVTGDLGNVALPGEFVTGREFLKALAPPDRVTVIPGNHDAYVRGAEKLYLDAWREYLAGDRASPLSFPFVRQRGRVALIGMSTAIPTPPLFATGRVGADQLAALPQILDALGGAGFFRVVLIHHPPTGERSWLRRFVNAEAFRAVIAAHGAELILSGHDHVASVTRIPGRAAPVPVVQVPSGTAPPGDRHGDAAYNLYRIDGASSAWRCELESRGIQPDGAVATVGRSWLIGSA